jgi:hypothetical protein
MMSPAELEQLLDENKSMKGQLFFGKVTIAVVVLVLVGSLIAAARRLPYSPTSLHDLITMLKAPATTLAAPSETPASSPAIDADPTPKDTSEKDNSELHPPAQTDSSHDTATDANEPAPEAPPEIQPEQAAREKPSPWRHFGDDQGTVPQASPDLPSDPSAPTTGPPVLTPQFSAPPAMPLYQYNSPAPPKHKSHFHWMRKLWPFHWHRRSS